MTTSLPRLPAAPPAHSPYETGLDRNAANFVPLSPLDFLARTAAVHPDRSAVVHGERRYSYREVAARVARLASALVELGVRPRDTVSILSPNTPAMLEAHHAVPGIGAVLNPLNIRLDAATIAFTLRHAATRVLLTDREFSGTVRSALALLDAPPLVVDIDDLATTGERIGCIDYESLLAHGDPGFVLRRPADEWDPFVLSYTSGTTGDPKGVVYHHRGAYLNAVHNVGAWTLPAHPVLLWTLPIFHSLGWCFPWTLPLVGGTQVCLRKVEAATIFELIARHRVTHLCGAPVVLNTLAQAAEQGLPALPHRVAVMTAASAPPPAVIERIERLGFDVLHVYGMTEVFGPSTICAWKEAWDDLPADQRARLKARQGVAYPSVSELAVLDRDTLEPVPRDAATIGEVCKRSNTVMRGYLKNPGATATAFAGGWFHSGDLAVVHEDGYIELRDRSKDIVISGGENISTIEVEAVLHSHPLVADAAVVARPDATWGETPMAYVTLEAGATLAADELIAWCRERLAHFKCPRHVAFGPLPRTATGKVQKFLLRERAARAAGGATTHGAAFAAPAPAGPPPT